MNKWMKVAIGLMVVITVLSIMGMVLKTVVVLAAFFLKAMAVIALVYLVFKAGQHLIHKF